MPRVFQKDCKIKVIEYGAPHSPDLSLRALVDFIRAFLPRKAAR